jgi:AraC-like DNA-binding protein
MLSRSGFSIPTRTTSRGDWSDMLNEHFVALDVADVADSRFTGAVRSMSLAHLQVSTVRSTTQRIARTDSLIEKDRIEYVQIGMIRRGRAIVVQDGRECVLSRGDFAIYDTSRPFDWIIDGHPDDDQWELEVFTWPRHMLRLDERESSDLTAMAFDGSAGFSGLLSRFLHDLGSTRSTLGTAGAQAIADEVGDLVSVIARNTTTSPALDSPGTALVRTAQRYIEEHLADPDLSPSTVASAMLVSTRQLHRLFAASGTTVARSIRVKRLERCRREIIASVAVDRSLGQISRRWGFADSAVFSRAFREQYGMSPRQYRAAACAQSDDPRAVTRPMWPSDREQPEVGTAHGPRRSN